MSQKYTFTEAAVEALKSLKQPSTARALWNEVVRLGLDKNIGSHGKTPWDTLSSRLVDNSQGLTPKFIVDRTKKPLVYSLNLNTKLSQLAAHPVNTTPVNKKYSALDAAEDAFRSLNKIVSARELWDEIVRLGLDQKAGIKGKTPWDSVRYQLSIDVKKNNSRFVEDRSQSPIVYSLKSLNGAIQINAVNIPATVMFLPNNPKGKYPYVERDLHPFLTSFAFDKLNNTYCKTIYHEKSNKKAFNEWIHPDLVGFSFPFKSYSDEVLRFTNNGFDLIKFYSFEMKRELDLSNLRESFFQAVSNSSWAHEGYLVAANIKNDKSLFLELERLSNSFGIGIIELILDDPTKTKILFPSKTKNKIDWDAVDKLVRENRDFKNFMNDVRIDVSNDKLHKENYDDYYSVDKLKKLYQSFK